MEEGLSLNAKHDYYVKLMNPCVGANDGEPLQILALAMTSEKLEAGLKNEDIAVDQTCRDASKISEDDMIIVSNPEIKPVWYERFLTWLDYQKVCRQGS